MISADIPDILDAAEYGNVKVVEYWLNNGIHIDVRNSSGLNCLHLGAKEGHEEVVDLVLRRGAGINTRGGILGSFFNIYGKTALHYAAEANHCEIVELLCNRGCDMDIVGGSRKSTALRTAACSGFAEVCRIILLKGGNPDVPNASGLTARDIARHPRCHPDVAAVFRAYEEQGKISLRDISYQWRDVDDSDLGESISFVPPKDMVQQKKERLATIQKLIEGEPVDISKVSEEDLLFLHDRLEEILATVRIYLKQKES